MALKESNEITVKVKCELEELYRILEEKGFEVLHRFSMKDTYFVPESLNLDKMNPREILSKAVLVREVIGKTSGKISRMITVKIKEFDEQGNILSQKSVDCPVVEIQDAINVLKAMGYKEIMNIKEDDVVYEKDGFAMAVKDIVNGDNLIEVETREYDGLDSVEKLAEKIKELQIPICCDSLFIKKAEVELGKVLGK